MIPEYKIVEITYSTREVSEKVDDKGSSKCTTYLVAHVTYDCMKEHGTVKSDLQVLATKSYDESGNVTEVTSTALKYSTVDEVIAAVKSDVESKISSDINKVKYDSFIRSSLSTMSTKVSLFKRDQISGLDLLKMNR